MKKSFLVTTEDGLYLLANDLKVRIATPPAGFTIPAPLQTAITAACNAIITDINAAKSAEDAHRAAVAAKNATKKAKLKIIREAVKDIKRIAGFNDTVANALGIDGIDVLPDYANMKPENVKVKKVIKGIEIRYIRDIADGAFIYCKRGSEIDFTLVNKVNKPTFIDARPNLDGAAAEQREYYLVYFKNDDMIGMASDIITVKS